MVRRRKKHKCNCGEHPVGIGLVVLGILWLLEPWIHATFNFTVPIVPVILILLGLKIYYIHNMK